MLRHDRGPTAGLMALSVVAITAGSIAVVGTAMKVLGRLANAQ